VCHCVCSTMVCVLYCGVVCCAVQYYSILHSTMGRCAVLHSSILNFSPYLHLIESLYLALPHHGVVNAQHIVLRLTTNRQSEKGRKQ
jgi:hypothetical protein